jgi:hypothetical protein
VSALAREHGTTSTASIYEGTSNMQLVTIAKLL